jgi:hypothetical protein
MLTIFNMLSLYLSVHLSLLISVSLSLSPLPPHCFPLYSTLYRLPITLSFCSIFIMAFSPSTPTLITFSSVLSHLLLIIILARFLSPLFLHYTYIISIIMHAYHLLVPLTHSLYFTSLSLSSLPKAKIPYLRYA